MALDGFSLACNIFQVISFTREVVLQVKDIYKSGRGDYDEQLINDKIAGLSRLCTEINSKANPISRMRIADGTRPRSVGYGLAATLPNLAAPGIFNVPGNDDGLLPVGQECLKASKEFQSLIANLNLSAGKGNTLGAIGAWSKTAWHRRKISKLEKSMERHEKLLDSAIFKALLTKTNAISLQQRSDSAQFDWKLQELIRLVTDDQMDIIVLVDELNESITARIEASALAIRNDVAREGQATRSQAEYYNSLADSRLETMTGAVADGTVSIKNHIDRRHSEVERSKQTLDGQQKSAASYEKLLKSVRSHEANKRRIEVAKAHEATFQWVFNPGRRQRWDNSMNPFELEQTIHDDIRTEGGGKEGFVVTLKESDREDNEESDEDSDLEGDEDDGEESDEESGEKRGNESGEKRDEESGEMRGEESGEMRGEESGEKRDEESGAKGSEETLNNHSCNGIEDPHMSCLLCWLRISQDKPYWVRGKPGSGKSTFMKYIAGSPKMQSILTSNYGDDALVLSHFIYRHGHPDQRSGRGVLLSLLHQYLKRIPDDTIKVQVLDGLASRTQCKILEKESPLDWSYEELEETLLFCLHNSCRKLLIFLDGLDEAEEHHSQVPVLQLVSRICIIPGVHVCVSSRPEAMFQKKFHSNPRLTLQHLTELDILTFVADTLRPHYNEDESRRNFLVELAKQLWRKAEGVFLWASIVARDVIQRLVNGDDDGMIETRLSRLPKDMFELYKAMLERSEFNEEDDYRKFASECFQTVRFWEGRPLVAYFDVVHRRSHLTNVMPLQEVKDMLERIIARPADICTWTRKKFEALAKVIPIRTSYLLEVNSKNEVRLIHRSAADFLDTAEGRDFLQNYRLDGKALDAKAYWCLLLPIAMQHSLHDFLHHMAFFLFNIEFDVFIFNPQLAMSLLYTCQRLYYSRMPYDLPASPASPEHFLPHASFALMLVRANSPTLLFHALTCDIGNLTLPNDVSQHTRFSSPQLPMVYSQEFLYFLIYQSVMVRSFGYGLYRGWNTSRSHITSLGYGRRNRYHWLFQNVCVVTKPETLIRQYTSAISIIATLPKIPWDSGIVMDLVQNLRTALQWEGTWDEMPICVLTYIGEYCWFSVFGMNGWCLPRFPKGKNGYLVQASIGFAVRLFISRVHRRVLKEKFKEEPLHQPLMDEMRLLLDDLQTRYPGGIPPATVLGGFRQKERDVSLYPRPRTFFTLPTDHPTLLSLEDIGNEPKLVLRGKTLPSDVINTAHLAYVERWVPGTTVTINSSVIAKRYIAFEKHTAKILKDAGRSSLVCDETCEGVHWQNKNRRHLFPNLKKTERGLYARDSNSQEALDNKTFFDMSNLEKKIVSKKEFLQELAKWANGSSG